ncbi:MAG: formylglycine-generating enzyme family protein, partial [Chloroflexi bacterium]|nr:formylglycine-generating enzyme family protein [Chloroflexota bacterium]
TDSSGRRRLDNPHDFVRLEIAAAMKRSIRVIPVLLRGTTMPRPEDLPPALGRLSRYNALQISDDRFQFDVDRLINALEKTGIRAPARRARVKTPQDDILESYFATTRPSLALTAQNLQDTQAATIAYDGSTDPTTLPSQSFILPGPFEWLLIPEGALHDERSGTLPAFAISRYPITNRQYDAFLMAADGYLDPIWWDYSPQARHWRYYHPMAAETAFAGDDLPRSQVSWYDCLAFARWLGYHENAQISLPTAAQWRRAAHGSTGSLYPWGNMFDRERCNCLNRLGGPTSVTQFPLGASPYGVMDMSGNIWEWTLTTWHSGQSRLAGDDERVLKGGSWVEPADYVRIDLSAQHTPESEQPYLGFRLVKRILDE